MKIHGDFGHFKKTVNDDRFNCLTCPCKKCINYLMTVFSNQTLKNILKFLGTRPFSLFCKSYNFEWKKNTIEWRRPRSISNKKEQLKLDHLKRSYPWTFIKKDTVYWYLTPLLLKLVKNSPTLLWWRTCIFRASNCKMLNNF